MQTVFAQSARSRTPGAIKLVALPTLVTLVGLGYWSYQDSHPGMIQAVRSDDRETIKVLLKDNPARVFGKDIEGWTPLHWAVLGHHKDMVELLLAHGADVNAKNRYGQTPLHFLARCEFPDVTDKDTVEMLLAKQPDINAASLQSGQTPLQWAVADGCTEVVKSLLEHGADVSVVSMSTYRPSEEMGHGHIFQPSYGTLIEMAVFSGNEHVAELLLPKFPKVDLNAKDRTGWTLLHKAVAGGSKRMVGWLLAHGAKVNAGDKFGNTPLDFANGYGFMRGDNSNTPAHPYANKDIAELLRQHADK
jgi:ankyrin repeat protein